MKCSQQCYTAQRRRRLAAARPGVGALAKAASGGATQAPPSVISGTWDFKWPAGKKLRVAFQQLPRDVRGFDMDFDTARALVVTKLDEWFAAHPDPSGTLVRPNLSYEVVPNLPAPPLHSHDSPRSAKSDVRYDGFIEYDVLVSLLPLPVLLPATEQHPEEVVSTSVSELGRYAHRIEYGVPTIYLGPQPGLTASQWFTSDDGVFTVVHELGHVLGMPHEQQNPLLGTLPWRPLQDMMEILEKRGGRSLGVSLEEFLRAEIIEPWPGEIGFSDWRQPPQSVAGLNSVMAKPSYRCLLQGGHPGPDCRNLEECPEERLALRQLQSPTPGDLQHLFAMYGARVP